MDIRKLVETDQQQIEKLLWANAESSLFMLSNLKTTGVEFHGKTYEGQYFGAFTNEGLKAIVVKYWNDTVMAQGDKALALKIFENRPEFQHDLKNFVGNSILCDTLVQSYRKNHHSIEFSLESTELLYALSLNQLNTPAQLLDSEFTVSLATKADQQTLIPWLMDYGVEALNAKKDAELEKATIRTVSNRIKHDECFILKKNQTPVSTCSFNAVVSPYVQIGGVWTPPEQRGKGYARSVVAGALKLAQKASHTSSILFTDTENFPAQKAYESIGYTQVGNFGLYIS